MKKLSKKTKILNYLLKGNKLTKIDSLNYFGCLNTGGRIGELRNEGHDINTKMVLRNGSRVAQYSLIK